MSWLAVCVASAALACLAVSGIGMFMAMGLAIFASALGFIGYRRAHTTGWTRLTGVAGATLGAIALLLAGIRYGVTLAALNRLEGLL